MRKQALSAIGLFYFKSQAQLLIYVMLVLISTQTKALTCSEVFQVAPPQVTLQLDFEGLSKAQHQIASNLKGLNEIARNHEHNTLLAQTAEQLNHMFHHYLQMLQISVLPKSAEAQNLLMNYIKRNQDFFMSLVGGKEPLVQLINQRIQILQNEAQHLGQSNKMNFIGFIQTEAGRSADSRPLETIGFIQGDLAVVGAGKEPGKNHTKNKVKKDSKLPTIGFIQPVKNDQQNSQKTKQPIGFIHDKKNNQSPPKEDVDTHVRYVLVIDNKTGLFDLINPNMSGIGFYTN